MEIIYSLLVMCKRYIMFARGRCTEDGGETAEEEDEDEEEIRTRIRRRTRKRVPRASSRIVVP